MNSSYTGIDPVGQEGFVTKSSMETVLLQNPCGLSLTKSQKKGFLSAMSGRNTALFGGAGTGKTVLIRLIADRMQYQGKNVLLCAPTGTAAVLIGGTTLHRAFGFSGSVCINEKTMGIRTSAGKLICNTDVLIIDEISMCRADLFDAVISSVKRAEEKTGKKIQVILSGDFFQLPPVLDASGPEKKILDRFYGRDIGNAYAFQGTMWEKCDFSVVFLEEVMRQKDMDFSKKLNSLRTGDISVLDYFNTSSAKAPYPTAPWLFPFNRDADELNRIKLEQLKGQTHEFHMEISGDVKASDKGYIPQTLILKEGARVMITVNETDIDQSGNMRELYHNGSTGTVTGFSVSNTPTIYIRLDNGRYIGIKRKTYTVYRYKIDETGGIERVAAGTFCQYPLRLAYASTIHRSQGQSYEMVNLDPRCRNPGQLYVALSRVRDIHSAYMKYPLIPAYVVTDTVVNDFYNQNISKNTNHVTAASKSGEKGGRPRRFPNGSIPMRIPNELSKPLNQLLHVIYQSDGTYDESLLKRFTLEIAVLCGKSDE